MAPRIKKGGKYKIKKSSDYFTKKYGVDEPVIIIEDIDKKVFGSHWEKIAFTNPAVHQFSLRVMKPLPDGSRPTHDLSSKVYYGKIMNIGECVFAHELEEVKEDNQEYNVNNKRLFEK